MTGSVYRMGGCALAALAVLALSACEARETGDAAADGPQGAFVKAHTIQQFMADAVQPTADVYWQSVQFVSDETGEHDIRPQTDEDWARVRTAGATLAEFGNLLMTPLYAEGRGQDWMDFSKGLVEMGLQAEQSAIDKDPEKVFEVGGNLYNVCSGCHQLYPPAAGVPDAGNTSAPAAEGPAPPQ